MKKLIDGISLTDFHYIADGEIPDDFEVCLLVLNNGSLSAGCWDTGYLSKKDGKPGCFRQSRGGVIDIDYVNAWLYIEREHI